MPDQDTDDAGSLRKLGTSPDLIEKFLDSQNRQVEAKVKETELQFQQDSNNFEYGKLALEAQSNDRVNERISARKTSRERYIFLFAVIALVVGLIATAMWLNKDEMAKELVKALIYVSAGALGGYGLGKAKGKNEPDPPQTP